MNYVERGSAVVARGSKVVGIGLQFDRSEGLAWVMWPDRCGLSECMSLDNLQVICDRDTIAQALQVIAPVPQVTSPLERAFLNVAQSQASTQIVEYDADDNIRPYYRPTNTRRR